MSCFAKQKISKKLKEFYNTEHLDKDKEFELIDRWKTHKDKKALEQLIGAHSHFVQKIARGYRGYGLPVEDMVSEGYIGIMQAIASFQPERGFRFSTYAWHCIKTCMQNFVLKAKSIVGVKPNNDNKKVFFGGIHRATKKLGIENVENVSSSEINKISKDLEVPHNVVSNMIQRYTKHDFSLNNSVNDDSDKVEFQDWIIDETQQTEAELLMQQDVLAIKRFINEALGTLSNRELQVIKKRRLSDEEISLRDLGKELGISAERVRQLEHSAIDKLKKAIATEVAIRRNKRHETKIFT